MDGYLIHTFSKFQNVKTYLFQTSIFFMKLIGTMFLIVRYHFGLFAGWQIKPKIRHQKPAIFTPQLKNVKLL